MRERAVGQQRVEREHVVARGAVAHRAAAAGIVTDHAANRGARGGGDIDRKPQPVRFELPVEVVEHDAGFDRAALALDVEIEDAREIFRAIDDQRIADRLSGLRGAAAARQHLHAFGARDLDGLFGYLDGFRRDHTGRHDLIVRCIGRVAAAGEGIEPDIPAQLGLEPPFQTGP